jgi:hypothetical protein
MMLSCLFSSSSVVKLLADRLGGAIHVLQRPLDMRASRRRKQTIVALGLLFALLLDLENADTELNAFGFLIRHPLDEPTCGALKKSEARLIPEARD